MIILNNPIKYPFYLNNLILHRIVVYICLILFYSSTSIFAADDTEPDFDLVSNVIRFIKDPNAGWTTAFEGYTSYKVLILKGVAQPTDSDQARGSIQQDFQIAQEYINAKGPNELLIITSHEFSRNGQRDSNNSLRFDASHPLANKLYYEMINEAKFQLDKIPKRGVIYSIGTVAIDTGILSYNKADQKMRKVGENRGFIGGSKNGKGIIEFCKTAPSNIDGWNDWVPDMFLVREGPDALTLTTFKDLTGVDTPGILGISVCLDITNISNYNLPLNLDFILHPAAGTPYQSVEGPIPDLLIADAYHLNQNDQFPNGVVSTISVASEIYNGLRKITTGADEIVKNIWDYFTPDELRVSAEKIYEKNNPWKTDSTNRGYLATSEYMIRRSFKDYLEDYLRIRELQLTTATTLATEFLDHHSTHPLDPSGDDPMGDFDDPMGGDSGHHEEGGMEDVE